ncbi:MAG TPA: PadR family transcriptional regulator [Rubrobacteraceae bacterium]|jgi:DNA-binding PadR family transcriptional regulator|nr:PadR family transcriptional regulator [Rubrobacteraceae bacterium]
MNMRDYAILAALAHEPKSGYDLAKWFDRVASHFCPAGYGSVYPALASFEREGLVEYETLPSQRGPERKVYSITEEGKRVLLEWAREPAADPRTRDEQLVKALSYGMLPSEEVLTLLEEARGHHAEKLAYYEELERGLEARLREGQISKEAYIGTLLVLRRGIGGERCYAEWCEEAKALVSSAEGLRVNAP